MHEGNVAPVEGARADQILEGALRVVVLGREHESRGVPIEPVHDTGAVLTLDSAQVVDAAVTHEGVRQGARVMPVSRVADEAALLG